jgi:hypothetical protein
MLQQFGDDCGLLERREMSRIVNDLQFGSRNLLGQHRVGCWWSAAIIPSAYDDSGAVDPVEISKRLFDRE